MKKNTTAQFCSLIGLVALFYVLTMLAMVIFQLKGVEQWRMLMASSALQNIGVFIIPAVITARIFNPGNTLRVMKIDSAPGLIPILLVLAIYVSSVPMLNGIVMWNENLPLPESLSWIRDMEDQMAATTEQMMALTSVGRLIIAILLIGVLTGIGEEFIFRGTIQRLISERNTNIHVAIWITAIIFSAIHFQPLGFVPRMLLGAYFGYLLSWSGSLWLPVLAHALNNSIAVIAYYNTSIETMVWLGESPTTVTFTISAIITALLMYIFYRYFRRKTNN